QPPHLVVREGDHRLPFSRHPTYAARHEAPRGRRRRALHDRRWVRQRVGAVGPRVHGPVPPATRGRGIRVATTSVDDRSVSMHRSRIAAAAAVAAVVLGAASPASAHEHRTVGRYELEVGWASEPTYAGVQNAVQVTITDAKGTPVDDLGDPGLTVTVSTGTATSDPLSLGLSFDPDSGEGTHGQFLAAVIPTRPGEYTFHVTGSIKGQAVDEKFTSGDTTFAPVKRPS